MAAYLSDEELQYVYGVTDEDLSLAFAGFVRPALPDSMRLVVEIEALERIRSVVTSVAPPSPARPIRVHKRGPEHIIATVAGYFHLRPSQIKSRDRRAKIVLPRQIAMYLVREIDELSFPEIGRLFERDNSTVQFACTSIAEKILGNAKFRSEVEELAHMCRTNA